VPLSELAAHATKRRHRTTSARRHDSGRIACANCGRVFNVLRGEALSIGGGMHVCRRPCTDFPIGDPDALAELLRSRKAAR
jgi:hypothetical protein